MSAARLAAKSVDAKVEPLVDWKAQRLAGLWAVLGYSTAVSWVVLKVDQRAAVRAAYSAAKMVDQRAAPSLRKHMGWNRQ